MFTLSPDTRAKCYNSLQIDLKLYSDILMRGVFGLSTSGGGGVVLFLFCVFFSPLSCTVHGVNEFDLILMFV